jgi:hypothetical protein
MSGDSEWTFSLHSRTTLTVLFFLPFLLVVVNRSYYYLRVEHHGQKMASASDAPLLETTSMRYWQLSCPRKYIRLIHLKRGSGVDPVHCTISEDSFPPTQEYEAVSYEWKSDSHHTRTTIYVDGLPVHIRKNLYNALLYIRRSEADRCLWIDDLCINQEDDAEKTAQVKLMGRIYREAGDVLVWLGLPDHHSKLAISFLRWIGQNDRDANDRIFKSNDYTKELQSVISLCTRPFWHRCWVVQEIVLARSRTFYCGNDTISGELFTAAGKYIEDSAIPRIETYASQIRETMASKIIGYTHRDLTLKQWLIKTQDSVCGDPRDKVFSLINLATDCRGVFEANYGLKDVSDVYRAVLQFFAHDPVNRHIPAYDGLDLAHVLQRALNINPLQIVRLTPQDDETIWICGMSSAVITSFDRPDKPVSFHTLYPKNIVEAHNTTCLDDCHHPQAVDCILDAHASRSIRFIHKRRHSEHSIPHSPGGDPVEVIENVCISPNSPVTAFASSFVSISEPSNDHSACNPSAPPLPGSRRGRHRSLKERMKDPRDRGKPFHCKRQHCSGFVCTDAQVGDVVCRFPQSRIGLVFRRETSASSTRPSTPSLSSEVQQQQQQQLQQGQHRALSLDAAIATLQQSPFQPDSGIQLHSKLPGLITGTNETWRLIGRAIMDERFQISEKETEKFWSGDPRHPESVSFGSEHAWYLEMSMVALQRLTAE